MVAIEGGNADGVTIEEDDFEVGAATAAPEQVIAAILGTTEGAAEAGYHLSSIGVAVTDQLDAAALRDGLVARKVENVMLVSGFLAAAALAQTVGQSIGYERIAMLFVEPENAALAVVDSADGSIAYIRRQPLNPGSGIEPAAELAGMVTGLAELQTRPDGLFAVGSGVDIAEIKPCLEEATALAVSAPEEPETALARGAALASANAPLFASSTAALAYAQAPATGEVDPEALVPDYAGCVDVPRDSAGGEPGDDDLAYSAVPDEEADACTVVLGDGARDDSRPKRRPVLLVGSVLAVIGVITVLALEIALAVGIRPTVALRPNPGEHLIVPTHQAPAPAPARVATPRIAKPPAAIAHHKPVNVAVPPPAHVAPPAAAAPLPVLPSPLPLVAPGMLGHMPAPHPVVRVPASRPLAHVPAPKPVHLPSLPSVHLPGLPSVHVPAPKPVHLPAPKPVHAPAPKPVHLPGLPSVHLPGSQPPGHLPTPAAPRPPQIFKPPAPGPAPRLGIGHPGGIFGGHGPGGLGGGHGFGGLGGGHGFGGLGGGHGFGGLGGLGGGHGFGGFGGFGGGQAFGGLGGLGGLL